MPKVQPDYRAISLILLVVQTSAGILTLRWSKIRHSTSNHEEYVNSTAVVSGEALKIAVCFFLVLYQCKWSTGLCIDTLRKELKLEFFKIGIPAVLYVLQNNLIYGALTRLDAATYQLTYQLKILVTALFSVILLGKTLTTLKWLSMFTLFLGVTFIQTQPEPPKLLLQTQSHFSIRLMGLVCVLSACCTSGFAGVYFEKLLKNKEGPSVWVRNIQLALYGFVFGIIGAIFNDGDTIMKKGWFQGYDYLIIIVIILQALGGLVIAAVIKYADNILKGFANAVSIIISSVFSYWLLQDFVFSSYFVVGAVLVILSTYMYGYEPKQPANLKFKKFTTNV